MRIIILYILLLIGGNCFAQDTKVTITGTSTSAGDVLANFYLKDSALSSDRTVDLNGKVLSFSQSGNPFLVLDPVNFISGMGATDGVNEAHLTLFGNSVGNVSFEVGASDGTNSIAILGDAVANTINYTAATHTFNGEIDLNGSGKLLADFTLTGNDFDFIVSNDRSSPGEAAMQILNNGASGYGLVIQGGTSPFPALNISYQGTGTSVSTTASSGTALYADGGLLGAFITSDEGIPLQVRDNSTDNNGVKTLLELGRVASSSATNGIGGALIFNIDADNSIGSPIEANAIISKWTDVTFASRTSELSFTGYDNASQNVLLTISGAGIFTLVQSLPVFANNAAAISGGLTINQLYRISVAGTSTVAIVE